MKDIHNHILYDIDDGSTSYQKSIEILNNLKQRGVTDIVATPHYIIGTNYNSDNKKKIELLNNLKKATDINLYIGNEVYLDNNIIDYIKDKKISTINNSRYLLIELPLNEKMECANDIIFELRNNGIVPILAHPERYHYLTIDDFKKFIDQGCLLQGNITSLIGKYGKNACNNLKLLLKKRMIHVLGTDTHLTSNFNLDRCLKILKKIVDEDIYLDLLERNFDKIINDEKIISYEIIDKKHWFKKENNYEVRRIQSRRI